MDCILLWALSAVVALPVGGALQVNEDARCGADFGFTCQGSRYGNCHSQYNFCGSTSAYCG